MVIILVEVVLGFGTKIANLCLCKSQTILTFKSCHKYFGYLMVILCKAPYVIIGEKLFLIADGVFLLLMIVWKLKFPKME